MEVGHLAYFLKEHRESLHMHAAGWVCSSAVLKILYFSLLPEQFVNAYIEDFIAQPEPKFEDAMRRVLVKNKELYKRLAKCDTSP